MLTGLALLIGVAIAWYAGRLNDKDSKVAASRFDEAQIGQAVVHSRQDIRLIAFLLFGILVMLGVIADLIHYGPQVR
jgi:hypothetical protein